MTEKKSFAEKLMKYVDGDADTWFEYFMLLVIAVNAVSIGLETSSSGEKYSRAFFLIDQFCLFTYVAELIIKIVAYNKNFFKYRWNVFDLIVVVISSFSALPYLNIFRVFKIFKSMKMIKTLKALKITSAFKIIGGLSHLHRILKAIASSMAGILWTLVLLLIIYYVYAIIGTNLFGAEFPDFFGSLGKSMLSLFQIMTFDSWCSEIARPIGVTHFWAWIYFVSFPTISSFIIMNVIVGIVVDSVDESRKEYEREKFGVSQITMQDLSNQIKVLQNQIAELDEKILPDLNQGGI
jgi:voltage-gated sodium channel